MFSNKIVLRNLKVYENFTGYDLSQTLGFLKRIKTPLVWQPLESSSKEDSDIKLGWALKGDRSLPKHSGYFKLCEGANDGYFAPSSILVFKRAQLGKTAHILHYSLDGDKKPLAKLGTLKLPRGCSCTSMSLMYNGSIGVTCLGLEGSFLMFWNLKTHEPLQTIEFEKESPISISTHETTLSFCDGKTGKSYFTQF